MNHSDGLRLSFATEDFIRQFYAAFEVEPASEGGPRCQDSQTGENKSSFPLFTVQPR